ncbi:hypothetical protein Lqui_2809 [Legionella quinlivanii]|uniref:Uncharacterized protein n=1 Tax=Legionella quinlivanii TaxID=45073 RepID=A0A0W0XL57_9GAMM|nr:hypothetical protein [Legionella quinlivanii]KTD45338.1 hypothetical protein Lqui_2809 [Legionella quinlivanii]MCW8451391.1 hypothetical protein [Legionella quinlivanii]SEG15653.1 hypothetical protein SAMN02746093_02024 [Legionella quinlivanii DSM 21216]STY10406.1 Uncharacterised protein [Legionella quinlivanii]
MKKADLEQYTKNYYDNVGVVRYLFKSEKKMAALSEFVNSIKDNVDLTSQQIHKLAELLLTKLKPHEVELIELEAKLAAVDHQKKLSGKKFPDPKADYNSSLVAFWEMANLAFGHFTVLTKLEKKGTLTEDVTLLCATYPTRASKLADKLIDLNNKACPTAFVLLAGEIAQAIPDPEKLSEFYDYAFKNAVPDVLFAKYMELQIILSKAELELDPAVLFGIDRSEIVDVEALIKKMIELSNNEKWDIKPYLTQACKSGKHSVELHKALADLFALSIEDSLRKSLLDLIFAHPEHSAAAVKIAEALKSNDLITEEYISRFGAFLNHAAADVLFIKYLNLRATLNQAQLELDTETLFEIERTAIDEVDTLIKKMIELSNSEKWDIKPYLALACKSGQHSAELNKALPGLFTLCSEDTLRKPLLDLMFAHPEHSGAIIRIAEALKSNNLLTEKYIPEFGAFKKDLPYLARLLERLSGSENAPSTEKKESLLNPENLERIIRESSHVKSILQGCLYLKAAQKLTQDNLTHIFSKPAAAHGLAQTLCGRDCFAGAKDKTLSKLIAAEKQEWLRQSKMNKLEDHINAPESDSERNSGEQIPARRKLSFFKLMEEAMLAAPVLNQEEGASVSMSPQ